MKILSLTRKGPRGGLAVCSRRRLGALGAAQRLGRGVLRSGAAARPRGARGGPRPISGARLRASRPFHLRPIDLVVFEGP